MTWTPIFEACRKFTFQFYKTYLIVRRQFSLSMYAGKTIHKAHGSTVKGAVMHFGDKKKCLSRVTSLSGVHKLELKSEKISISQAVEKEMKRLQS